MTFKSTILLTALLALSPLAVHAAPVDAPVSLDERAITNDCPKRTFNLVAQKTVGSLLGTVTYAAVVVPEDGGKQFVEITSCMLARWGDGCKWLNKGRARIERPGGAWWTVEHTGYSASRANNDDITMNGDNCNGQVQHCTSGVVQQCYPDPVGGSLTCILDNNVSCNQEARPFIHAPKGKQVLKSKDDLSDLNKQLLSK